MKFILILVLLANLLVANTIEGDPGQSKLWRQKSLDFLRLSKENATISMLVFR